MDQIDVLATESNTTFEHNGNERFLKLVELELALVGGGSGDVVVC